MPLQALGPLRVTTPGVPVAVASIIPTDQWTPNPNYGPFKGHGVLLQALRDNNDDVYVGQTGMNSGTLAKVLSVLAPPSTNFIPSFSAALTIAPNAIDISDLYIDADQAGDGVLVSILVS